MNYRWKPLVKWAPGRNVTILLINLFILDANALKILKAAFKGVALANQINAAGYCGRGRMVLYKHKLGSVDYTQYVT